MCPLKVTTIIYYCLFFFGNTPLLANIDSLNTILSDQADLLSIQKKIELHEIAMCTYVITAHKILTNTKFLVTMEKSNNE